MTNTAIEAALKAAREGLAELEKLAAEDSEANEIEVLSGLDTINREIQDQILWVRDGIA